MTIHPDLIALLDFVVAQGGSGLDLFTGRPPMIRISGSLGAVGNHKVLTDPDVQAMLRSIVPEGRWDVFERDQSIDLSLAHKADARFRINGYRTQGTTAIAMRLIPRAIRTFAQL